MAFIIDWRVVLTYLCNAVTELPLGVELPACADTCFQPIPSICHPGPTLTPSCIFSIGHPGFFRSGPDFQTLRMATKSDNEVIFVQVHLTLGTTVGHLESSAHSMYDFFPTIKILAQKFIYFTRSKAISFLRLWVRIKLYIGE